MSSFVCYETISIFCRVSYTEYELAYFYYVRISTVELSGFLVTLVNDTIISLAVDIMPMYCEEVDLKVQYLGQSEVLENFNGTANIETGGFDPCLEVNVTASLVLIATNLAHDTFITDPGKLR